MKLSLLSVRSLQAVLVFAAVFLVGCASGPKIHSVYEKGINFSEYKTFAFLDSVEPAGEQAYRSLTNKYLQEAIRKELTSRGLTEQKGGDLLVGFHVSTKEKITSTSSPSMNAGYYGYRGRYGYSYGMGYGTETRVSQYTEGTLNIDVVDANQKQLVWEGVAVGKLKEPKENKLRGDIHAVVQQIFMEYPVAAPMVVNQ
ncbi:DUF4136 domain-containing protein [Marinagarivorans cellulosilyticus]|uniref:DUF4136 domain-containing protein n=1 Tax=Marinagarivorans cellulosilyticus TaxID=2721545 RepID=A0AAN1WF23_9GAMM|nr:DUF4136 domain-containing protein [Marinagarivorans cellulosilyticus]BCD96411.1 hypothetical protein MARGE09_P0611 [Marinagarivorans cellulosilyticus]